MVAFWALVIYGTVWLLRGGENAGRRDDSPPPSPKETLKRRLARGEISIDEYRRVLEALDEQPPAALNSRLVLLPFGSTGRRQSQPAETAAPTKAEPSRRPQTPGFRVLLRAYELLEQEWSYRSPAGDNTAVSAGRCFAPCLPRSGCLALRRPDVCPGTLHGLAGGPRGSQQPFPVIVRSS
jgi:hypothetical protein